MRPPTRDRDLACYSDPMLIDAVLDRVALLLPDDKKLLREIKRRGLKREALARARARWAATRG